ncbi:MAG: hypothetical protein V4632_21845 [Pseudomonadota bacterium]
MQNSNSKSRARFRQRVSLLLATTAISVLAACGGGGGGDDNLFVNQPVIGSSNLFVADKLNQAIVSVVKSNLVIGAITLDRLISGPKTHYLCHR